MFYRLEQNGDSYIVPLLEKSSFSFNEILVEEWYTIESLFQTVELKNQNNNLPLWQTDERSMKIPKNIPTSKNDVLRYPITGIQLVKLTM